VTSARNWVLTGADGMLAKDVRRALADTSVRNYTRADLDITDAEAVDAALDALRPGDILVNCAAYTAVDDAETDEANAFAVNATGAQNLARACSARGAWMVQISTDYVFSGTAGAPYPVDAPLAPRSAYGRSKAAGEWAVRAELPERHWILRTAWLYGQHGPSFVRSMARLEATREVVDVVDDQHGQPTWTRDLADRIVEMADIDVPAGTYHGCASGRTTWFGLAGEVFRSLGADPERVRPTSSEAFVRPAPRPAFSVLDLTAWDPVGLRPMRDWREAFHQATRELHLS